MGRPAPRRACCRGPFLSPCSWVGVRETLSVQRKLWAGRGMRDLLRAPGRGRHLCPPCWGVVPPCWGEGPGCWSRDGAHGAPLRRPPSLRLLPLGAAGGAERGPCVPSCAPTLPLAGMGSGSTEPGLASALPHSSGGSRGNTGTELSSAEPPGANVHLPAALPALPACACGTWLGMNVAKHGGSAPVRSRRGERHTRPCALSRGWPGGRRGAAWPWSWGSPRWQRRG